MENNTQRTPSDLEKIKTDLKTLYKHVGDAAEKKSKEASVQWNETRSSLERKKVIVEERASELAKAGSAASSDMKSGFTSAYNELKKAFEEAKNKFDD